MFQYLTLLVVILGVTYAQEHDPCYNTPDSNLGLIGSCIPESSCNGVTQGGLCPSFPGDHTCCFDVNLPGREVRGAWIASVTNIDWPVQKSLNVSLHQAQLLELLEALHEVNINTLYFQVRPHGDALYPSDLEPWSVYLTGTQGLAPDPLWDPLQFTIDYAHARGMEVHAWFNPYRANMAPNSNGFAPNHMARRWPQCAYAYGNHLWMDPGCEVVSNFTYEVCMDIFNRYDLDGLHMDDYFYPYPVADVDFPDDGPWNDYVNSGGNMSRPDWRRDNVNRLVKRLNEGIREIKPWAKWTISPFGLYRPGHPEGMPDHICCFDQYESLYADPKLWLQEGWIDVLQPQLYWQINATNQSFPDLLDWWLDANTLDRHVYPGVALYRVPTLGWPWEEIIEQYRIMREDVNRERGAWGHVLFSAKYIRDDYDGAKDIFQSLNQFKAIQPEFPWLARAARAIKPNKPIINIERGVGYVMVNNPVHKTAIYRLEGKELVLEQVLFGNSELDLPNGKFGISSIDRYGQESDLQFIQV